MKEKIFLIDVSKTEELLRIIGEKELTEENAEIIKNLCIYFTENPPKVYKEV